MPKNQIPKEVTLAINRRRFIYYSALAAGATAFTGCVTPQPRVQYKSPNEKLNVGAIGVGGKGTSDIQGAAGENIVALCDADENTLNRIAKTYPGAKLYRDYRKMLEENKELDAVIVSTPDHHHYLATMMAIQGGRHVYVQKPLTHSLWEARQLTLAARKYKVATQMGNQGHCGEGVRELCEIIWAGAIGDVREVHSWSDRPIWPQGMNRPAGEDTVPSHLDWELWLGPAPMRPYMSNWPEQEAPGYKRGGGRPVYHPFAWRGWWDFGCGALGDMGCHIMDPANWALKLGAPTSVEVVESSGINSEMAPKWSVVRYQFPKRGKLPPVTYYWHDGGKKPQKPAEMEAQDLQGNGTLFIGSKGKMICDAYGGSPSLLPESKMKDYVKPAQTIPRVPENNAYLDWIRACKGGPKACSNFGWQHPAT